MQVELSTVREESTIRVLLRITDEGIGIPVEDLARIFQWYSRGKNALQTTIEGAGIGLAGARDIVVQHGGSISVSSKEGQGIELHGEATIDVTLVTANPRLTSCATSRNVACHDPIQCRLKFADL